MASRYKKYAIGLLQLAITAAVLTWLFSDSHKRAEMALALKQADPLWIVYGVLAYGVVEMIAGWRWVKLLKVQGIELGLVRTMTLLLIGLFFNFFIPGGTGGDVMKIFYLVKEAPGKATGAVLSVLVDRIIGLIGLILMSALIIFTQWNWLTANGETYYYVWAALIVLGVSVGVVGFSMILTALGVVHRLPPRFPGREKLAEIALGYSLYAKAWPTALFALMTSIAAHLGYFFIFYCAARAFAAPTIVAPNFSQLCAIMPVINTITALPIGVGGLGIREGLFQVFLNRLVGVDEGVAVLISTTGFFMTAVWGALGGLLYLGYRPARHARMSEIDQEVAALEHDLAEDELALEIIEDPVD